MSQPASPIGSVEFIVKFDSMQSGFVDALKEAMKDLDLDMGADPQLTNKIDDILDNLRNRLRGIWTGDRAQFLTTAKAEVSHLEKTQVKEGLASAFRTKKVIEQEQGETSKEWIERSERITKDMIENWQLMIEQAVVDEPFWIKMRKKLITWQGGFESALANWENVAPKLFKQIIKELTMEAAAVQVAKKHDFPLFTQTSMTKIPKEILEINLEEQELGAKGEGIEIEVTEAEKDVKSLVDANILLDKLNILKEGIEGMPQEEVAKLEKEEEKLKAHIKEVRESIIASRELIKDTIDLEDMLARRGVDPKQLEEARTRAPGKYAGLAPEFIKAVEDLLPDIYVKVGTKIANVYSQIMREKIYGKEKVKEFPLSGRAGSIRTDLQYMITEQKENQEKFTATMTDLGMSEEKIQKRLDTANELLKAGQTFVMFTEALKTLISPAKRIEALSDRPGDITRKDILSIADIPKTIKVEAGERPTEEELEKAKEEGIEKEQMKEIKNVASMVASNSEKLDALNKAIEEAGGPSKIHKKD